MNEYYLNRIKELMNLSGKFLTTISLFLTHLPMIVIMFITIFSSFGETKSLVYNFALILGSFFAWMIYFKKYVKSKNLKKNPLLTYLSILLIMSTITGFAISDDRSTLGIYDALIGMLNMALKLISVYLVLAVVPLTIGAVSYVFFRNANYFWIVFFIIITFTVVNTLDNNMSFISIYIAPIAAWLSKGIFFFIGGIAFLHFNYLFYNNDYDKFFMMEVKK